jgi:hypothetical protein
MLIVMRKSATDEQIDRVLEVARATQAIYQTQRAQTI